jgi:hypothetical protein
MIVNLNKSKKQRERTEAESDKSQRISISLQCCDRPSRAVPSRARRCGRAQPYPRPIDAVFVLRMT